MSGGSAALGNHRLEAQVTIARNKRLSAPEFKGLLVWALDAEMNTTALDLARLAKAQHPQDAEFPLRRGKAFAALGAMRDALIEANECLRAAPTPIQAFDAHCVAGQAYKSFIANQPDFTSDPASHHLGQAIEAYQAATAAAMAAGEGPHYPEINCATLRRLAGDLAGAERAARDVLDRLDKSGYRTGDVHWQLASAAEALLLLGDAEAPARYREARQAAMTQPRPTEIISSMRRQLRLIAQHQPGKLRKLALDSLDQATQRPVAVFTGNMIDKMGRASPRFPPSAIEVARQAVRDTVLKHDFGYGVSQPACGGDLLFLEAIAAGGGRTHVVMPFASDDYRLSSVSFADEWFKEHRSPSSGQGGAQMEMPSEGRWEQRYGVALARAAHVTYVTRGPYMSDNDLFVQAGLATVGIARLHARAIDAPLRGVALADPMAPRIRGGATDIIQSWRSHGVEYDLIDLPMLIAGQPHRNVPTGSATPPRNAASRRDMVWVVCTQRGREEKRRTYFTNAGEAHKHASNVRALDPDENTRVLVHAGPYFPAETTQGDTHFGGQADYVDQAMAAVTAGVIAATEIAAALFAAEMPFEAPRYLGASAVPGAAHPIVLYVLDPMEAG